MVALVVIMAAIVVMPVSGPRGKGVGKMLPTFRAARHFIRSQETPVKLRADQAWFHVDRHQRHRLAPVAKWLLPLLSRAHRHLLLAHFRVPRRPPLTRRGALQLGSGKVKAADEIRARSKPEKSLRSKNMVQIVVKEPPKPPRMKWSSRAVCQGAHAVGIGNRIGLFFNETAPF